MANGWRANPCILAFAVVIGFAASVGPRAPNTSMKRRKTGGTLSARIKTHHAVHLPSTRAAPRETRCGARRRSAKCSPTSRYEMAPTARPYGRALDLTEMTSIPKFEEMRSAAARSNDAALAVRSARAAILVGAGHVLHGRFFVTFRGALVPRLGVFPATARLPISGATGPRTNREETLRSRANAQLSPTLLHSAEDLAAYGNLGSGGSPSRLRSGLPATCVRVIPGRTYVFFPRYAVGHDAGRARSEREPSARRADDVGRRAVEVGTFVPSSAAASPESETRRTRHDHFLLQIPASRRAARRQRVAVTQKLARITPSPLLRCLREGRAGPTPPSPENLRPNPPARSSVHETPAVLAGIELQTSRPCSPRRRDIVRAAATPPPSYRPGCGAGSLSGSRSRRPRRSPPCPVNRRSRPSARRLRSSHFKIAFPNDPPGRRKSIFGATRRGDLPVGGRVGS